MSQKAPGKLHRKGLTLKQLFRMFPDDATAGTVVRGTALAGKAALPLLRIDQLPVRRQAQDHALSLPGEGVREALQRSHQDAHGSVESRLPDMGHRALSGHDEPQGRVEHGSSTVTWGSRNGQHGSWRIGSAKRGRITARSSPAP